MLPLFVIPGERGGAPLTAFLLGLGLWAGASLPSAATFVVIDTDQVRCYDDAHEIPCPQPGQPFSGQDAQHDGMQPAYRDNGDGTVTNLATGLMWQQSFAWDLSWADAVSGAPSFGLGGYHDWRFPTIKELYSLIEFSGVCGTDFASSTP